MKEGKKEYKEHGWKENGDEKRTMRIRCDDKRKKTENIEKQERIKEGKNKRLSTFGFEENQCLDFVLFIYRFVIYGSFLRVIPVLSGLSTTLYTILQFK